MMALLADLGSYVRGLGGWRRLAFAWAAGLASAFGFAPFGAFPLLLLGYAALVLLIDGAQFRPRPIRASAYAGFAFGFGQFLLGLHWIGFAFMVEPGAHAWQIPFVALLFPGGLALFYALACAVSAALWRQGPSRIFLFTACLSLTEWARGHLLTGFPWNIAAYGWGASLGVLQSVALFGAYGLTLLTILFGASLAEFFGTRPRWIFPSILTGLFVVFWIGGEMRLAAAPTVNVPGVRLRLVQPNIAQADKINRELISRNWKQTVSLSVRPASPSPTIIVWPEAAPGPFLLTRETAALDEIAMLTGRRTILMTGHYVENAMSRAFPTSTTASIFSALAENCSRLTTNSIWSRSANTCHLRKPLDNSASANSPALAAVSRGAMVRIHTMYPVRRRSAL